MLETWRTKPLALAVAHSYYLPSSSDGGEESLAQDHPANEKQTWDGAPGLLSCRPCSSPPAPLPRGSERSEPARRTLRFPAHAAPRRPRLGLQPLVFGVTRALQSLSALRAWPPRLHPRWAESWRSWRSWRRRASSSGGAGDAWGGGRPPPGRQPPGGPRLPGAFRRPLRRSRVRRAAART